ncbi:MAG: PSD1 domain-containing protein [Pirellulaceae bacterium]|nr:PSD1 domain-containing protein [Pirellulaceae bacterium]
MSTRDFRMFVGILVASAAIGQLAVANVDFDTQIRPILVEHCLACHGQDEAARHGGLRLDIQPAAIEGGDSGRAAIVPGDSEASELMQRVTSQDTDARMPPESHGQPLSTQQIAVLRQWIQEGAHYAQHWAFTPPRKVDLPTIDNSQRLSRDAPLQPHPIDALVHYRLAQQGLSPSPPESPWTLCRRLYLDIVGLPPSIDDLNAFQRDGYLATVQRLLASQRYGERWARPWLDAARYSDTNGYEKDLRREQWAWRDWVIRQLNADLPYDQFIIQQIAGDLLPNASQDEIVATGFLRNSMINEEGAIVPEEFRMVEMFDRLDCLGKAVLGLSAQCAQCHTHKFDPLSQDEYYGLFAFLNDTYEARSWVYTPEQQAQIDHITAQLVSIEQQIRDQRPAWQSELDQWSQSVQASQAHWQPISFDDMNSISGLNHPVQQADLSLLMLGHNSDDVYFIGSPELTEATGLRLEVLTHRDLPFGGPGRNSVGGWGIRELELFIQPPDSDKWDKVKLVAATADFSEAEQKHNSDKDRSGPVQLLIDGADNTWWRADRGVGRRNTSSVAVVQFEQPLSAPAGTRVKIAMRMNDMAGCCRLSLTKSPQPVAANVNYDAVLAMATTPEQRTPQQAAALFWAWHKSVPELESFSQQIDQLWQQYPSALTSVLHLAERQPHQHRDTHFLSRGQWDRPEHVVAPHVPAALHDLQPADDPPRLQFARWLVDRRSPLAARVAVNRVWQNIFGRGLVETAEDFGSRTPIPEYRDLLDWLAVDFMENGWSTKHLIRQIVTSQIYQQTSRISEAAWQADPDNRWLARGPRFRADAEVVRDMALALSGLIHHELGGPGVIPPVPQNVLDYNYVYPSYWTPAEAPERYRRTVYSFRKRSMPDPAMSSLDAPNGDFACARRVRSNTPLAALTGLNEPIFVESSRALGLRILSEGGSDDLQRINFAYLLCMARYPSLAERTAVQELLAAQRQRLAEGWLNAREIITGKPDTLPSLPPATTPQDAAAWALVARVLLNLDETISKN